MRKDPAMFWRSSSKNRGGSGRVEVPDGVHSLGSCVRAGLRAAVGRFAVARNVSFCIAVQQERVPMARNSTFRTFVQRKPALVARNLSSCIVVRVSSYSSVCFLPPEPHMRARPFGNSRNLPRSPRLSERRYSNAKFLPQLACLATATLISCRHHLGQLQQRRFLARPVAPIAATLILRLAHLGWLQGCRFLVAGGGSGRGGVAFLTSTTGLALGWGFLLC